MAVVASLTGVSHLAGREDPECEATMGLTAAPAQDHHTSPIGPFPGGFPWPPPHGQQQQQQAGGAGGAPPDNQCMFCFKSFSNRGSMTRHLRDQHLQPGATVTCDICGKVCKNRNCLITHRSVAHSSRRRPRPQNLPQTHHQQQQQPVWLGQDKGLVDMLHQQQQEVSTDQA